MPNSQLLSESQDLTRLRAQLLRQASRLARGDTHAAEDLVQSALLSSLQQRTSARSLPGSWYRRVLYNQAAHRWSHASAYFEESAPTEYAVAKTEEPQDIFQSQELRTSVRTALDRLPIRYRRILELRFIEGFLLPQVALTLGLAYNTVRTQQARGLRRLRQMIEPQ